MSSQEGEPPCKIPIAYFAWATLLNGVRIRARVVFRGLPLWVRRGNGEPCSRFSHHWASNGSIQRGATLGALGGHLSISTADARFPMGCLPTRLSAGSDTFEAHFVVALENSSLRYARQFRRLGESRSPVLRFYYFYWRGAAIPTSAFEKRRCSISSTKKRATSARSTEPFASDGRRSAATT
jgi:hypothetical protein